MTNFRVGQKVVCVDATPRDYPVCLVTEGKIYTIHSILGERRSVRLVEVTGLNPFHDFYADRFRPLVSRSTETGMAILRDLLKTTKAPTKQTINQG